MSSARSKCPTCGSPVVIAAGGEGTNHYVPANTREQTEERMRFAAIRSLCDSSITGMVAVSALYSALGDPGGCDAPR